MRASERRARDLEALEDSKLEDMIIQLEDPNVPEKVKGRIREQLKAYYRDVDRERAEHQKKHKSENSNGAHL